MIHTLTQSTVYSTAYKTITSCAPDVIDCPARSTVVSSTSYSLSKTMVPATTPTPDAASSNSPVKGTIVSAPGSAYTANSPVGAGQPGSCSASYYVKAITTTTVIPTVIYETHSAPCATITGGPGNPAVSGNSPVGASYTTGRTNAT